MVRLFGSRADNTKKGGDIDLHLEPENVVLRRVCTECQLAATLAIKLGGRRVDLLIRNPGGRLRPIDDEAHKYGVVL